MKKVRLYIADPDEVFISRVRAGVARSAGIDIVGSSGDGQRALRDIAALLPDVLLTDISLPGLDGISLIRQCGHLKRPPVVVVCTGFYSAASIERVRRHGASFFLCKPVEPEGLVELLLECGDYTRQALRAAPELPAEDAAARRRSAIVHQQLKQLGIPARLSGSRYIAEAVIHYMDDELLLKNLSNGLYMQLAGRMDTTVSRVERSLRSAIAIAYERGTLRERMSHRPTNKEFIEYIMRAVDEAEKAQRTT